MNFDVRYANHPEDSKRYDTQELRKHYHISKIFTPDQINLTYSHQDRIIAGGIMPVETEVKLETCKELAAPYFLARRELGAINVGGAGVIVLDGVEYPMGHRDCLYIAMGTKEVVFKSDDPAAPAKFYMVSAPAHARYETRLITIAEAAKRPLGSVEECNKRVINQFIHPSVLKTCQLSMGMTVLESGSVWNTMPAHTHERRMEMYMYFDIDDDATVFHFMGTGDETRHLAMRSHDVVVSPMWSIHAGVGMRADAGGVFNMLRFVQDGKAEGDIAE